MDIRTRLSRFRDDEEGSTFLFGFFLLLAFFMIGGLAVDVGNAYMNRTQLQVAADSAAHAALYLRNNEFDEASSIDRALTVADEAMPAATFGAILNVADVQFGTWNRTTKTFTAAAGSKDAVQVDTARLAERANPVATHFLRIFNIDFWDIRTRSVFETYIPTCMREGFVGQSIVDMQSNNHFTNGFCVHSQTYVEFNSNNLFDNGAIVSMPDKNDVVIPESGFASNPGLEEALRDASYPLDVENRVNAIAAGVTDPSSPYFRSYITATTTSSVNRNEKMDADTLAPGGMYRVHCNSASQQLHIPADTVLTQMVLITNCQINFGQGAALESAAVISTNTGANSISAASGLRLGVNDSCATGGGAQIATLGGVSVPAKLQLFGGQIIAAKSVDFSSDAFGVQGGSIISGGTIDGTTGTTMGFCGTGMEDNFEHQHLRLVL